VENNLRELRQDVGISQQALATELGVSRQTIISIEKGKFDPSLPLAFKIAHKFHVRIEDVFIPDDGPVIP
jgi:putative transcriptional regulator